MCVGCWSRRAQGFKVKGLGYGEGAVVGIRVLACSRESRHDWTSKGKLG